MRKVLLLLAAALVVLGVVSILLQPGPPDSECVPEGQPSSGFVDEEKDCNISIESWEEIADHNSSPKPFRIVGLLLIVIGVGTGIASIFIGRRKAGPTGSPSP